MNTSRKNLFAFTAMMAVISVAFIGITLTDSDDSDAAVTYENYTITGTVGQSLRWDLPNDSILGAVDATKYSTAHGGEIWPDGLTFNNKPTGSWLFYISGTPTENITGDSWIFLYAPGHELIAKITLTFIIQDTIKFNSSAYITINAGTAMNFTPSTTPSDATIKITSNLTGISLGVTKNANGTSTIKGTFVNILPGTYYVTIQAEKSGFMSATQTLIITIPVYILDPVSDVIQKDTPYTYQITTIPSSASIQSYVIQKNGITITSGFTSILTSRSIKISFADTGQYHIFLTIGAAGYSSTSKELILEVTEPPDNPQPPVISSILATPSYTTEGVFYFTAIGAQNYTSITWDFSDGSIASGTNVVHQYMTSGEKTATVTLYNSNNGLTVSISTTISVTITSLSKSDAWVTVEYSYAIPVNDTGNYTMTTDISQAWLTMDEYTDNGQRYVLVSGTPFSALANSTLEVTISNYGTWTIYIWPYVDDSDLSVMFSTVVDGYTVTLTNNGSKGNGVIMYVDWGTTNLISGSQRYPGSETATAQYAVAGQYSLLMTLYINGKSYSSSGLVTVPSHTSSFSLSYDTNGGTGTMPTQNGVTATVLSCMFTQEGETFLYWNTQPNGKGTSYNPGDKVILTSNVKLYAIWSNTDTSESDLSFWILLVIGIFALIFTVCGFKMPLMWILAAILWIILGLAWRL